MVTSTGSIRRQARDWWCDIVRGVLTHGGVDSRQVATVTLTTKQFKRFKHHTWRDEMENSRIDARWRIIQLANQHKMRDRIPLRRRVTNPQTGKYEWVVIWSTPTMLGMKHLHRAVRIVRHYKLGNETLLRTAGFRPQT